MFDMPTESGSIRPDLFLKMSVIVLIVIDTSGINKDKSSFLVLLKIIITIANYAIIFKLLV